MKEPSVDSRRYRDHEQPLWKSILELILVVIGIVIFMRLTT